MITADEVRELLRNAVERAGSQRAWAAANGVSQAYVSDVLLGHRDVSEEMAARLGFRRLTLYEPAPKNSARR